MMQTKDDAEDHLWELACSLYSETQTSIRALDEVCFKVKGWAFTVWTLGAGFAVQSNSRTMLLVSCCPIFVFWLVDVSYKFFHEQFLALGRKIEEALIHGKIDRNVIAELMPAHHLRTQFFVGWLKPSPELHSLLRRHWHHAPYFALLGCSALIGIFAIHPKP